ncbi:MAG: S58 family peptidase [Thermoleophilia bacterium]|nr:S58 family peptidase [Thermoleophilia bacterium]
MDGAVSARGPRPRQCGIRIGRLPTGPRNGIGDVPGVRVGHVTVWRDEPEPPAGRGVARTGVTAIVPADPSGLVARPLPAGVAVLNGAGELTGALEVFEWGVVETPLWLTSSMQVGRVLDGAVTALAALDPRLGADHVVLPVVGECDDSWLSEARLQQVVAEDAGRALAAATETPEEGAVGAGTGMTCFGWKGGIGTSSRVVRSLDATLGVLVLANYGSAHELRVDGVPVGEALAARPSRPQPAGSCIAVVVTDAPLDPASLERVARRCGLGLARTGSVAHDGSGEIFLALSTGARRTRGTPSPAAIRAEALDELFAATVEATEEAVLNALWAAPDVTGREGRVAFGLPHEETLALLAAAGRLHR